MAVQRHPSAGCRKLAGDLLADSRHPGVLRLLFEHLGSLYPPRRVFEAFRTRDDPEFVAGLLRWLPAELGPVEHANLRQIDTMPWLDELNRLADLPGTASGEGSRAGSCHRPE